MKIRGTREWLRDFRREGPWRKRPRRPHPNSTRALAWPARLARRFERRQRERSAGVTT